MLSDVSYNPDVLNCLANLSNDEVFTPPRLVNEILDHLPPTLWADPNARFLDPFCKSGVFLREIAKRLIVGLEPTIPDLQQRVDHIYRHQLYGIAITELTALLSRRSLYCSRLANGRFSVASVFDSPVGNIRFNPIKHSWKQDKCLFCGASRSELDREDALESHAYEFIHTDHPQSLFPNMKFDVIVGNPPYQLSDGGFGTSAKPIYNLFVEQAKKLNPRYLCMIIPARWYAGGKGLDSFRSIMLNDKRINQINDYPDASELFPGVQIKGGICYFLWDRDYEGPCKVVSNNKSKTSTMIRPLLENGADTFIRFNEAISILKKIQLKNESTLKKFISSRKPFGLETTYRGRDINLKNDVLLYQNGGTSYISREEIPNRIELVDRWKVLIPPLGSGSDSFPHQILGRPFVAPPNSACTETYLIAGTFDNEIEANNLASYLKTKFLRFLVLLNKPTQHATSKVYIFVPIQDFKLAWTDKMLYEKYSLTDEEIAFIDTLIRPME